MIDLTPLEVRKKKGDFRRAMRGYETSLVDDFLDLAADRMEELVRENLSLTERLTRQEQQVAEYREREKALTEALVTAQEMREEIRRQSTREAELAMQAADQETKQLRATTEHEVTRMRTEAQQESARVRADLERLREREEEAMERLRSRQRQFLGSYRAFLERELTELGVVTRSLALSADAEESDRPTPSVRAEPVRPAPVRAEPTPVAPVPREPVLDEPVHEKPMPAATAAPLAPTTFGFDAAQDVMDRIDDENDVDMDDAADEIDSEYAAADDVASDYVATEDGGFDVGLITDDAEAEDDGWEPFEPEPFEPEPFEPELEHDVDDAEGAAAEAEDAEADRPDLTPRYGTADVFSLELTDAGDDHLAGDLDGLSLVAEGRAENDEAPRAIGRSSHDDEPDYDDEDEDDEETTLLLRNAAAAGYRLPDEDELLLVDEVDADVAERGSGDDGSDDDDDDQAWLPTLLEDRDR